MSESPVVQLRSMIHSQKYDMSSILLQAMIIAKKLGDKEFGDWLEYEYRGYPSKHLTPTYRLINLPYFAQLNNGQWQRINFEDSPLSLVKEDEFNLFKMCGVQNPLSQVENMSLSNESITAYSPEEVRKFLSSLFGNYLNFAQFPLAAHMGKIVADVKMLILNWVIELECRGVLCEDLAITQLQKEVVTMNFGSQIFVGGDMVNSNIVGDNNNHTNQKAITNEHAFDFDALSHQLREIGINEDEMSELKKAIEESPKPKSADLLGEKIGGWMGKMVHKGFAGGLKIAATSVQTVITRALCLYYGLPV